jgi:hypothetical protein
MNPIFITFIITADLADLSHHQNFLQWTSNGAHEGFFKENE